MKNAYTSDVRMRLFYKNYDEIKHNNSIHENPSEHISYIELKQAVKTNDTAFIYSKLFRFITYFKHYEYEQIIAWVKVLRIKHEGILLPNDFIDLKKLEYIGKKIVDEGFIFTFEMLYEYCCEQVKINLWARLNFYVKKNAIINKSKQISFSDSFKQQLENAHRRIKYSQTKNNLDIFAQMIKTIDDKFALADSQNIIIKNKKQQLSVFVKNSIDNPKVKSKVLGRLFFKGVEKANMVAGLPKKRKEIILAFEPIFHEIFGSDEDGILSEIQFDASDVSKYDSRYNRYYSARVKSLTGY